MDQGMKKIAYWEGEPIAEMSHEKLVEIIIGLAEELEKERILRFQENIQSMRLLADAARRT